MRRFDAIVFFRQLALRALKRMMSMSELEARAEQISVLHLMDIENLKFRGILALSFKIEHHSHQTYVRPVTCLVTCHAGACIVATGAPRAIASAFSVAHAQGALALARLSNSDDDGVRQPSYDLLAPWIASAD